MSRVPCAAGMVQPRILFERAKLVSPVTRGFDPGIRKVMRSLPGDRRGIIQCRHPRLSVGGNLDEAEGGFPSRAVSCCITSERIMP